MTKRLPCPPAPGPLEAYAARFDELLGTPAQRRGFREYLAGLPLPRDRNRTLTGLAGTEPVVGAQHASVQRLRFFVSESAWDHETVNARRLEASWFHPYASTRRARRCDAKVCSTWSARSAPPVEPQTGAACRDRWVTAPQAWRPGAFPGTGLAGKRRRP
ncbi:MULTISPECIES: hypothetical protein [unclassified Streptomyces]|uniref:hypothetical protein n=1 Tax=unclassified Streptomyces TaxID=2593676 RepID=UPI00381E51BC